MYLFIVVIVLFFNFWSKVSAIIAMDVNITGYNAKTRKLFVYFPLNLF